MLAISLLGFSQLQTLPFSEDFSGMQLPNQWSEVGTWNFSAESDRFSSSVNGFINKEIELNIFGSGETAEVLTPFINVSTVSNTLKFRFEQRYTMLFDNFCYILLTPDGGLNWDTIHQNLYGTDDHVLVKDLSTYISGVDSIQMRFSFGYTGTPAGSSSDYLLWEFDDMYIYEEVARDLSVLSINTPNSGCESTDTVNITITNLGTDYINEDVTLSYFNGTDWIDEVVNIMLPANEGFSYTFATPIDLGTGLTAIQAKVTLSGDEMPDNDILSKNLNIAPSIQAFPYNEDFESTDGNWYADNTTNGTWEHGQPNSSQLVGGATNSTNAWVTNLTGVHGNSEESYLYSPCYDFSSLNTPEIELDIWYQSNGEIYSNYSGLLLEYSLDNGASWIELGNNWDGGLNWYDYPQGWFGINNEWKHAKHEMAVLANEPKVNFRFYFKSFNQPAQEGYAVDNIFIHEAFANDLALSSINSPTTSCGLTDEIVNVTIDNVGTALVSTFDIAYTIDGTNWTTETINQTIAAGSSENIDFTQTVDLSISDIYNLQAKVILASDENTINDEKNLNIVNQPVLSGTEIFEDFEGASANFWILDQAWNSPVNDWELGTPATANLNNAYSGTNAWVTNTNGTYITGQTAYVVSPCLDLSGITNPAIEFYLNNRFSQAHFDVEYSVDGGISWNTLGATYSLDWYQTPYSSFTMDTEGYEVKRRTLVGISDIDNNPENVKLRFVFVSTGSLTNEGAAFDDFRIYQDDDLASTVGVEKLETVVGFNIYPNPAKDQITISNNQLSIDNIKIIDITGTIVKEFTTQNSEYKIQTSDLPKGVYFVKVGSIIQKLIKE